MRAYFFLIFCLIPMIGCQRAPVKRTYHEIVQSAPAPRQPSHPAIPMSGEMDASSIPNDDIHVFLREGQNGMPSPMPMTGAVDQQTQKMLEASVARPPLSWTTPQGWQETPGYGMRLVTFISADKENPVECAIISLGGQAGGLESNAARWMKQVNIDVPAQAELGKFLAAQKKIKTKDGFDATIIDLTQLQSKDDLKSPSMTATIITLPDMTVFVKMTGTRGAVLKNKEKFETLCESLKLN
ncbi:MAG: hypothetical protein HZC18_04575 [Candidatus Omnitrophica bacterium]|nr:hypothetical protein [Candidatus Omnitrophota bacterium]